MTHQYLQKIRYGMALIIMSFLLLLSVLFALSLGSASISDSHIWTIASYHLFGMNSGSPVLLGYEDDIIWNLRMPRIALGVIAGVGLSVSGVIMQAVVRNVLADPYILGLSSGASLGATIAIMFGLGTILGIGTVGVCAFIGACISAVFVLFIAGKSAGPVRLLLSGMVMGAICSSFSGLIVFFADNKAGIQSITFWLMGSLGSVTWEQLFILYPVIILCSIALWMTSKILNLMLLGDEVAIVLGRKLDNYRKMYILIVSCMVGFIVYASGMIGFVGLIIPHCVRSLFGVNHWKLLPPSALAGAIFLVWVDIFSRILIKGTELPIGILVSVVAAPFFVYLMMKNRYKFGGTE